MVGSHPMSVVENELRVHGLDGLRVIDASVMPAVTSTNTNAPTIMIAEKGAAMINGGAAKTCGVAKADGVGVGRVQRRGTPAWLAGCTRPTLAEAI